MNGAVKPLLAGLMAGAALIASGCSKQSSISYRVTVTVNDHGTQRSGSGVWKYSLKGGGFPNPYTTRFWGEAFPIDMGSKGRLYVLTVGRNPKTGLPNFQDDIIAYGRDLFGEVARIHRGERIKGLNPEQQMDELRGMIGRKASLDCAHLPGYTRCPFLVRFRNEQDPMTVEAVDPTNLAATYGPDVSLSPITIQLTDEDPTDQGISKRLHWVSKPQAMSLNGNMFQSIGSVPGMLQTRAFKNTGE